MPLVGAAAVVVQSTIWLAAMACCMIMVQSCDAAIGLTIKDRQKTFGPAMIAVCNPLSLSGLCSAESLGAGIWLELAPAAAIEVVLTSSDGRRP